MKCSLFLIIQWFQFHFTLGFLKYNTKYIKIMDKDNKSFADLHPTVIKVLNNVSLVSASIVVLTVVSIGAYILQYCYIIQPNTWTLIIGLYKKRFIDRVSFRIQTAIALCDILRHVVQNFMFDVSNEVCHTIGYWMHFLDLMYALLNLSIAINMQLMLINNFIPKRKWETVYWLVPFLVSMFLSVPFLGIESHTFYILITSSNYFFGQMPLVKIIKGAVLFQKVQ